MNRRDSHRVADKADKAPDKRFLAIALRETDIRTVAASTLSPLHLSQAEIAIADVEEAAGRILRVCDVAPPVVREAVTRWRAEGKGASTINARLSRGTVRAASEAAKMVDVPGCLRPLRRST